MTSKVLIVDDQQGIRDQLTRWLSHEGYKTEQAANGEQTLKLLKKFNFHVVLLDLKLPDVNGYELLSKIHRHYPDTCVIVLTAYGDSDSPARAREAGAFDFFSKPIQFELLIHRIDAAIETFRAKRERDFLLEEQKQQFQFETMIGKSEAMQRMFELIERVANSEETVLVLGESGTGKDLVAGAIHYNSRRKDKQLIVANCAALPEHLAESELFGHEKGAFTGAIARKIGKFERADGTSLFIDEIGELSLQLQTKFLRFLQEKTIERVGGTEPIYIDTRIIAVTNLNFQAAVTEKRFREDLFHRLSRVIINVPPLR
ncbi:MAG: sigma-54-dependent Fis family transcriptional regulator, partial [Calditrichaeota bacterium]